MLALVDNTISFCKMMFFNTAILLAIIVIFDIFGNSEIHAELDKNEEIGSNNTCHSQKCIDESKFYVKIMDRAVDPCDNFFSFACGGFVKNSFIPEDEFLVSQYGNLNKKIQDELITELKSGPQHTDLEAFKKIKNFYANCINETQIKNDGIYPILDLLEKFGGWPVLKGSKWKEDGYRWENTISLISKTGLLPDFPLRIDVVYDTNEMKYILDVRGVILEVDSSYNMTDKNSKHYIQFMTDMAVLLGGSNETAYHEMKDCLEFELKLFKALYTLDESTEHLVVRTEALKVWITEFPEIPWLKLLNGIFNPSNVVITEDDILLMNNPRYFSKLDRLLNNTSERTLANYQIWRIIYYNLMKFTPKEFREKSEKFEELINEKDKPLSREKECLTFLQHHSPAGLNSLYIQKIVNERKLSGHLQILENVRNEAKEYFQKLDWMKDELRRVVLEKLQTMKAFINYHEELLNTTKIEDFYVNSTVDLGSALYSYLNITKVEKNYSLRMLRYSCKENDWAKNTNVASVTANYDIDNHQINIAAGMLQSPFFDTDRPKYLNYGELGYAIGHEIIHGIDTSDGKKNYSVTWDNTTVEEYKRRAKCIIDQFSNYTVSEYFGNVDGERTFMENVADGGGLKLGYYAYNNWIKNNHISEPLLPQLNYTAQQMYWISAASSLCSKLKNVPLPSYIRNNVHSPDVARINIGFSNIVEFAEDFNCPVNSMMNPARKCIVW